MIRPADQEACRHLIILVDCSVEEGLLAARGPCAPTSCITAVANLVGQRKKCQNILFSIQQNVKVGTLPKQYFTVD